MEVGTTRPETLFADCALAVNPNDERYVKYIGLRVRHPLFPDRKLPVLSDTAVQLDKGTGGGFEIYRSNLKLSIIAMKTDLTFI